MRRHPWRRALHAALSGWLVGLLAAGPAAAQAPLRLMPRTVPAAAGAPRLVVLAVPVDPAARASAPQLAQLAERAVADANRFTAVSLAEALDTEGAQVREASARQAAAAFEEGQRAYDELDTQRALQAFDRAARSYENSDLSRHFAALAQARVMKAASQMANGEVKAAQLEAEAVLGLNPRAEFSPNYFPPEVMAFVEKTRKAVLAQADATLEVKTTPVPAQVYVDGQLQGLSPVKVSGLTRSDHFVTVMAPGYAVAQSRARDEVALTLEPLPTAPRLQAVVDRAARDPEGPGRDAALRELGTLAGAEQVLGLLVRAGPGAGPLQVTAVRVDVADGHNAGYAVGSVPTGNAMADGARGLLGSVLSADAPRVGGKPVTHFDTGEARPSTARRTVGFVLLATGVAMMAGGAYFGLEASSRADTFKRTPQTSPRSADLRSEGQTFALIADVGVAAGLVTAGVGTWLAFFGGKKSEPEPARPAPAPKPRETPPPAPRPERPRESLPMPPPPGPKPRETTPPAPARTEPAPPREDPKRARETEAQRKREEEARRKQEEAAAQRAREEQARREEEARRKQAEVEAQRKREEEARRKREEEERRKREEEEKKKRPALDEDDLRNY